MSRVSDLDAVAGLIELQIFPVDNCISLGANPAVDVAVKSMGPQGHACQQAAWFQAFTLQRAKDRRTRRVILPIPDHGPILPRLSLRG